MTTESDPSEAPPSGNAVSPRDPTRREVLTVFVVLVLLYLGFSWMRPLASPDEPRYSEVPREMVASGDWISPRLNGVLFLHKPPLLYWLEASAIALGGTNLFLLRFWPAVFALAGCAAVYWAGSRLYDRRSGFCGMIVLGTSLLYFAVSQLIIMDMVLSVLLSGALFCFIVGQREAVGPRRRRLFHSFYALLALAVLTKGLVAILVPGAVIFLWLAACNRWSELRRVYLVSGSLILLAIALPWHLAIASRQPAWFDFYIIHEHFLRYVSGVSMRGQPVWFFFVVLPVGLLPWVSFLPQTVKAVLPGGWRQRHAQAETWFLVIWAAFILLFFSASRSKLMPYIIPAFPPLALMIGRFWALPTDPARRRSIDLGFVASGVVFLLAAIALPIAVHFQRQRGEINETWLPWVIPAVVVLAVIAGLWFWRARRGAAQNLWPLAAGGAALVILANPLLALLQPPSARPMVARLQSVLAPDDLVFSYQEYLHDFPLYLGRTIGVVDAISEEQSFGLQWEDHSDRYFNMKRFRSVWANRERRIFAVMTADQAGVFQKKIRGEVHEVARDSAFCIFVNRP